MNGFDMVNFIVNLYKQAAEQNGQEITHIEITRLDNGEQQRII